MNITTPYQNSRMTVIGIDHGYGNIKTANTCFPAGVTAYAKEPTFSRNVLYYEGTCYSIGEGHKEFTADKIADTDYYILTLAAIARELELRGRTQADVYLATGLPLTWVSEQKDRFRKYLTQKRDVDFTFRDKQYLIRIIGAEVFPQGFAAVASKLADFKGTYMLCDIGNGTMNIMSISNGKPNPQKCYTEKFGVYQCTLAVREQVLRRFGTTIDDDVIEDVLRNGTADIAEKYLNVIQETARNYVNGIMRRLREHEYNPDLMKLYIVGGGGCLIRNFADYDTSRVTIDDDICATAKGYEFMAELRLKKAGSV
ncbi:MAG: ParM/StbA family protein [Clostridia bacterium]|nr:ParM/StbA family protein [Clostridia bacterium]MBR1710048.1 ParM/StbA family protein [Clostridia bacterium]